MNIKACNVTIKIWKTAHPKWRGNCHTPNNAIRIKINSPANMLPKSLKDNDSGFASNETASRIKLKVIIHGAAMIPGPLKVGAIGCSVNSARKPPMPFVLIE